MEKVKRAKIVWLIVSIVSAALCVASIPCMIVYGSKGMFIHLAVCVVVAVQGFWGVPVYVYNFFKARLFERITAAAELHEISELDLLAEAARVSPSAVGKLAQKCIKKGYLKNFKLEGGCLQRL